VIAWPELIGFLTGVLIVAMLARLVRRHVDELGTAPANVPVHGPTNRIARDFGRGAIYVGRAGPHPWIQMPEHECHLTPRETRALAQALERHAVDGLAWEAMEKVPIKKS
jgi:hypothetical protein